MGATKLKAYHGKASLKRDVLAQMAQHRIADQLVQGQYWSGEKGCAVSCLTHHKNGGHSLYPKRWGIPLMLAHLEDRIFEGLSPEDAQRWPERFLTAIPVGKDLSRVGPRFLLALITRQRKALDAGGGLVVGPALDQVIAVLKVWAATGTLDAAGIGAARRAESAARSAAWSAAESARSAESAAVSAVWSAESAVWSAESAAVSAASAAWSAAVSADGSTRRAARRAEYRWMATTLCRLLRAA